MHKGMMIALTALLAGTAHTATNYELHPASCGTNTSGTCEVYRDTTTAFGIYWNYDGTLWLSKYKVNANNSLTRLDIYYGNAGGDPRLVVHGAVLTDGVGQVVVLSGDFDERTTTVGSGRGQHRTTYVTFLGGELSV